MPPLQFSPIWGDEISQKQFNQLNLKMINYLLIRNISTTLKSSEERMGSDILKSCNKGQVSSPAATMEEHVEQSFCFINNRLSCSVHTLLFKQSQTDTVKKGIVHFISIHYVFNSLFHHDYC